MKLFANVNFKLDVTYLTLVFWWDTILDIGNYRIVIVIIQ